ncbi:enoyl-CoA hydratase-related protein [Xanthobacter autotrophicus]|uniref:enoyl-CoA hydratase-related protein n=1 Tax=Xanthobacter autotrophicus TaxID=280 RepID=UPI00372918DE
MAALDMPAADDCRAALITGAGRGFCAGQDLAARALADQTPDLGASLKAHYNPLVRGIRALRKPVICAVNGRVAGAGASIALACHIVLAARSAKFIPSSVRISFIPDFGGTLFPPRFIGDARARALMLLAEPLPAETATEWASSGRWWTALSYSILIRGS